MTGLTRPAVRRAGLAAAAAAATVLLLSACGGGGTATASTNAGSGENNARGDTNNAGAKATGRNFPGVMGQIAAISGQTLQVQNTTSQTSVVYSPSTAITETIAAAKSDLAVGKCVQVRPATDTAPAATPDPNAAVTAATVAISDPVNGSCTRGLPGGRGGPGMRADVPAPNPVTAAAQPVAGGSNSPGGRGGRGFGVFGSVTSINGDTVTITETRPLAPAHSSASPTTSTRTVTLTSATTYTRTQPADSTALQVGGCVTAFGTTTDTGTLTATAIAIRPATSGSCNPPARFGPNNSGGAPQNAGGVAGG